MGRIYSNSFFHYTQKYDVLVEILKKGFVGSYANEQFPKSNGTIGHLYIPMISFCDIPLSQLQYIVYGNYAIGMSRVWGNDQPLCPVSYFPNNRRANFTKFITDCFDNFPKNALQYSKILGYVKPVKKFKENGYAPHRRRDNYIEREWRKIYLKDWLRNSDQYVSFNEKNESPLLNHFIARFRPTQVDMIIVESEEDRENHISKIQSLQQIGGYHNITDKDRLLLISKITTIDEIKKNY